MLEKQICKPDTSVDPMTVVSKGAALYASTVELSEEIKEETRDKSKIQLEIGYEASTVEIHEWVTIKILEDKTEGEIPSQVFAEIMRGDKAWSSGKIIINEIGEMIDIQLLEDRTNNFEVSLYDDKGNLLESEPKEFTVIQGSKIGSATLPYSWGIEIKEKLTGNIVFNEVSGLEKNKSLPAIGTMNGLKTQKQIRPGMTEDFIKIPLYQGESGANGTRAIYNEHVYDIIISGLDLPALLPENSDVDITISLDKSQKVTVQAYFPYLEHTAEIEVPTNTIQSIETNYLSNEIRKAKGSIQELKEEGFISEKLQNVEKEVEELENKFENNRNDVDNKQEILANLRKNLKVIDELGKKDEWETLKKELKEEFYRLEKAQSDLGNDRTSAIVQDLRRKLEEVIRIKDMKVGKALLEDISTLFIQMTMIYQLIGFIQEYDNNFGLYHWKDAQKARRLLNQGMQIINETPDKDRLHPIVVELINLLPEIEKPSGDSSVLVR